MPIEFPGLVIPFQRRNVLVYGPEAEAFGTPLFGPPVYLQPGYRLVGYPDYLLPDEAIDDVGQRFKGAEAYDWIERRGDAFPRADAIGTTLSGQQQSVFLKELDLAALAMFAAGRPGGSPLMLSLALEARPIPDGHALAPIPPPAGLELFTRALPAFRLAPGAFGAVGAALVAKLLASGRRDWTVTFDQLDDLVDW